jgi:hypothetical protein
MLRLYSTFFLQLGLLPQIWPRLNAGIEPDNDSLSAMVGAVKHLMEDAERLQMPSTLAQCKSIEYYVTKHRPKTFQEIGRLVTDLYGRALDELAGRCLLMVTLDRKTAYEEPVKGWELPIEAFHSSQNDIEEAQRCYALDRSTACVFHLMRALETPLKVLSNELGIVKHKPTWEAYLSVMPDHIKAKFPDQTKEHGEKRAYFTALEGHLRAIKTAWRNPTMHEIARVYTSEMAHELIVLVRGFMREAAVELCEP